MYCAEADASLRSKLLNLPCDVWSIHHVKPQQEKLARLNWFNEFHKPPSSGLRLRVAPLCLQLIVHAVSLTAQTVAAARSNDIDREPVLVRLGKGEVQRNTCHQLISFLCPLHNDVSLGMVHVVRTSFTTEAHILIRFHQYAGYPAKL